LRFVDEGHPTAYNWVAAVTTTEQRALYNPLIRTHTCAWWDDKGETHPFDNQGPDLKVPIELPEGQWRLSAYLVDYDWHATWHPRRHGLVLTDDSGGLLAVAGTGKFGNGVWQRFIVRGPCAITLRVCKNASSSAILSALMLDRIPPLMPVEACGLARDRASLPQEAVAEYQAVSELLASSPLQYSRRLEEIAAGSEADPAEGVQAGLRVWLRWQVSLWACSDRAATDAHLDAYITALRGTVGDSKMPPVLDAQVELLMASRQLAGAQALDARRSDLLTGGQAGPETVQTAQKLIDRWLPLDDRFATRAFEKQVQALVGGPPDITLPLLAALVEAYADQGRELMPEISGPYRPMVAGHPKVGPLAEPVGIPGFEAIVLPALKDLPRDVALKHFAPFLRRLGERERLAVLRVPGLAPEERLRRFGAVIEQTLGEPRVTASVRSNCVRVLAESGRIDEALAASVELWAMSPEDVQQWGHVNLTLGEALVRRGRYAEAIPVYRQVVDRYRETEPAGARAALKALAELARLQGDADAEAKARTELEALKTP
jgi:tetratricopeptide (TPR) repeat protein